MESHHSQCPQEPVECPFTEAGCKVDVRRQQFEDHMTTSLQQHLMLLMIDRKQLKTELNEMKAKLSQAETRLSFCEANSNLANKLKKSGDSVKIIMPRFSEYRRSGKVWHSLPFYYGKGYKMCLAVHANGVGEGAGTHVSLVVLHLRGEYDDQLKWPTMKCAYKHFRSSYPVYDGVCRFLVCRLDQHPPINEHVEIDFRIKFCSLNSEKIIHMVNDCLTFQVKHNNCFLAVEIN
jgi:hypothetical protein